VVGSYRRSNVTTRATDNFLRRTFLHSLSLVSKDPLGSAVAQAVSRRLLIAKAGVRARVS
jgi:hypothetical protein